MQNIIIDKSLRNCKHLKFMHLSKFHYVLKAKKNVLFLFLPNALNRKPKFISKQFFFQKRNKREATLLRI